MLNSLEKTFSLSTRDIYVKFLSCSKFGLANRLQSFDVAFWHFAKLFIEQVFHLEYILDFASGSDDFFRLNRIVLHNLHWVPVQESLFDCKNLAFIHLDISVDLLHLLKGLFIHALS